jgi:rod shape-determining protein MreC
MRNSRRGRLVLTVLLLAAFSLITLDYRSGALEGVRKTAASIFGPIESGLGHITHPVGSWFSSVGHLGSYRSENADLKRQVAALKLQQHLTQAEHNELVQDQKLLHIAGIGRFSVVAARVVAYGGADGFDETATINKGSANGIRTGQTVIAGDGLVGRTIHVGRNASTILLANDPTFQVGARTEGKQLEIGRVQGGGTNDAMLLTMLNTNALLATGVQLVTFGSNQDRPFVPEVPIGSIIRVNPQNGGPSETATVKPFVNFTSINIVAVVTHAPPHIAHGSLLPASPTPAPTVTVTVTATPGSTDSASPGSTTSTTP